MRGHRLVGIVRQLIPGICIIVLIAAAALPVPLRAQEAGRIERIVVEGTQRVEAETVRSYLLVREGDLFDASRVDRSLKSLFATGLFADVTIDRRADTLVVTVAENPVINRIAFEGNTRIDDDTLEAEVSLRPRVIYTRTKVQSDVRRILTLYRRSGRFAATVEPKIIKLPQNRIDLVFEINEGEATEITSIQFVGNEAFSDSKLREVIRTRTSRWWRFFSTEDTYDPDRLTLDQELLRRFYLSEGYADLRVVSAVAELTPDRRSFYVTFTLEEGERYRFGTITVESTLRGLEPETISDAVSMEEGEWYNADQVERSIDALADAVANLGHAFVDVQPRIDRDRDERKINVSFEISEGPRVFVERINITGNVRTLDKVIRREIRLVEGDPFNAARIRRSRQRIRNLDYFESVEVDQVPGSAPDKAVVNVNVKEKSTGSLSIGAGFSTTSGLIGDVTLRERNLLGQGQDLRLRVLIAQRDSQISLSFTEPYFLDREISAGVDAFLVSVDRQDESSFDESNLGGAFRFGYPITEDLSQAWRYSLSQTEIENVPNDASEFIKQEEGTSTTSEIFHTILYDKRNNRISPTEGYFARLGTGIAGLGGDVRYIKNEIDSGYYIPVIEEWVLAFRGKAGYIFGLGQDVQLFDRYFVGGDDLRGFETAGVGPRDLTTDDSLGGNWFYTGTVELSFPLGLPEELPLKGRVFTDLGSVGGIDISSPKIADTGSLRASVGAGVTWVSPFGPIGIDLGYAILKEDFDKEELIRFNFGARF